MPPSIHARHAEAWRLASPWVAEWLFNIVIYCSTPEGQNGLHAWVMKEYGEEAGRERIAKCKQPQLPGDLHHMTSEDKLFARASTDLSATTGVHCSPAELKLEYEFCRSTRTAMPERKNLKAAPTRRKGETSEDWLTRRNEAFIKGSATPEMDWQLCRAIAISELDRVRDNYVALRADMDLFTEKIMSRRESIIASLEHIEMGQISPISLWVRTSDDAWRAITLTYHLAHAAWSQAVELFEDLATQGITTPRSLERAYKRDINMFWRLLRTLTAVDELERQLRGQAMQIVTHSEYYRPWFKRYRKADGFAQIDVDQEAVKARPPVDKLDETVLQCWYSGPGEAPTVRFWTELRNATKRDARVGQRFSAAAYEVLGDFAIVQEFWVNMYASPWGETFRTHAKSILALSSDAEIVSRLASVRMGASSPSPVQARAKYERASSVSDDQVERWLETRPSNAIYYGPEFGIVGFMTKPNFWVTNPGLFDPLMLRLDVELWEAAKKLDKPGQPDSVARMFGLMDPADPNRLTYTKRRQQKLLEQTPIPHTTPAPAARLYEATIPISVPGVRDEAIVSGHKYSADTESQGATKSQKKKKKKKGKAVGVSTPADDDASGDTTAPTLDTTDTTSQPEAKTVDLDDVPDTLPSKFLLPRKMAKTILRLLDGRYDDTSDTDADARPAKGDVRWQDFEKVMRRIGFQVVQTAGSSVRFEPPAKTARPISFHRPHPDAVIPHIMAKWYGARLSRVYGWTMSTFEVITGADKQEGIVE